MESVGYYNEKQITDLAMKYSLVTKYTSFVAVFDNIKYQEYESLESNSRDHMFGTWGNKLMISNLLNIFIIYFFCN